MKFILFILWLIQILSLKGLVCHLMWPYINVEYKKPCLQWFLRWYIFILWGCSRFKSFHFKIGFCYRYLHLVLCRKNIHLSFMWILSCFDENFYNYWGMQVDAALMSVSSVTYYMRTRWVGGRNNSWIIFIIYQIKESLQITSSYC